jgi:putative resolvase
MKNKRLLTPSEAAAALGISLRTLYRWEEADKVHTIRTVGNQRRIPIEEVSRLRRQGKGQPGAERCALYARVSSVRQAQDGTLARQMERLKQAADARGYEVVALLSEQASALNEQRKGMRKLLTLIKAQAVEVILLEDPDRLVRFGFSYLEEACSWQDLLTIVTVFAGRLYGHRAKGVRKLVQTALKEYETEQAHGTSQQNDQAAP